MHNAQHKDCKHTNRHPTLFTPTAEYALHRYFCRLHTALSIWQTEDWTISQFQKSFFPLLYTFKIPKILYCTLDSLLSVWEQDHHYCSGKSGTLPSLINPAQAKPANHSSLINPAQASQAILPAWSILLRQMRQSGKQMKFVRSQYETVYDTSCHKYCCCKVGFDRNTRQLLSPPARYLGKSFQTRG